ncbi:MAG TPA: DUF1887 family CARF protein [Anaerolineales bacterium]|nr:DUF1887 family CARF protein [Anaerolineales bacterium]
MKVLVLLIGEQILPNLLPLKYIKPDVSVAVFSDFSKRGYVRLEQVVQGKIKMQPCQVDAYNIEAIIPVLMDTLGRWGPPHELWFNITGGTKPMSIAAYLSAEQLHAPVIYFQSEGKRSRVLHYEFWDGKPILTGNEILPAVITLDEYLQAHVDLSPPRQRGEPDEYGYRFQNCIYEALTGIVDEIKKTFYLQGVVEIDLAVRCENQVGIVEIKTGKNGVKAAIDQLTEATEQRYLGTYTQKFLVTDQDLSLKTDLKELASAHHISIIELPGFKQTGSINETEAGDLRNTILNGLGRKTS